MLMITEDAVLRCAHPGSRVSLEPSQALVTIAGRRVLVESDPEGRRIGRCPNYGPTFRPCQTTLKVRAGYSDLVRITGRRVCLDTIRGLTDGTPAGLVHYKVDDPGQQFVHEGV